MTGAVSLSDAKTRLSFIDVEGPSGESDDALTVAPSNADECSRFLKTASDHRWRVGLRGSGTWNPPSASADLVLTTHGLDEAADVRPADLVVTVGAGVRLDDLQSALSDHGVWFPVDPPGAGRSLGSILATATSGPLRHGLGPVRDHVLGLTFVTGDGRLIQAGGQVVKNVAGYDLTRLLVGSFGAFGVIVSANLRLRARPRRDRTVWFEGDLDSVVENAIAVRGSGIALSALEISHATRHDHWTLAARLQGTDAAVGHGLDACIKAASAPLQEAAADYWSRMAQPMCNGPVTLRMGVAVAALAETIADLETRMGPGTTSVTVGVPTIRWNGTADIEALRELRTWAAAKGQPMVIERAPDTVLCELGHFGAFRPGVSEIVSQIRRSFDHAHTLAIPLQDAT